MPSNYVAFEVKREDSDGTQTLVPLQTVGVYDVTNDEALADLTSDAEGHIDAGSLDVDAGTLIRFTADLGKGQKGYAEQVTTA